MGGEFQGEIFALKMDKVGFYLSVRLAFFFLLCYNDMRIQKGKALICKNIKMRIDRRARRDLRDFFP